MTPSDRIKLRKCMVNAVKIGNLVYYGDLMDLVGLNRENALDRALLGEVLAEINDIEMAANRPILSVVAVNGGDGNHTPSKGFYSYVDNLSLRNPGEDDLSLFSRLYSDAQACTSW